MATEESVRQDALVIKGTSRVSAVIGDPVEHSLSPLLHNTASAYLGIDHVYVPFRVRPNALHHAVTAVRALDMAGINVTIPHKVAIMPLLDELTPEARLIGAVNTVQNRAGYLIGHNTDGRGFARSLREEAGFEVSGKHVLVLGAGGAARAIVAQMMLEGAARITIANRTPARAQALVRDLQAGLALLKPEGGRVPAFRARAGEGAERPQWTRRASSAAGKAPNVPIDVCRLPTDRDRGPERALLDALQSAHLVVNATPVGMAPNHRVPPILRPEWLSQQSLVCDIVYSPLETSFLTAAKERGCRTLNGLGMLIFQGAVAYELFTGFHPPIDLMRDTLRRYLLRHAGRESAPSGGG